jgi:hypothetical protein
MDNEESNRRQLGKGARRREAPVYYIQQFNSRFRKHYWSLLYISLRRVLALFSTISASSVRLFLAASINFPIVDMSGKNFSLRSTDDGASDDLAWALNWPLVWLQ